MKRLLNLPPPRITNKADRELYKEECGEELKQEVPFVHTFISFGIVLYSQEIAFISIFLCIRHIFRMYNIICFPSLSIFVIKS